MEFPDLIKDVHVEILAAEHGDCILVRAAVTDRGAFTDSDPSSRGEFRILIDTGPGSESLRALKRRLLQLQPQVLGHRYIDLLVLTHLDADHIGNAKALLTDADLRLRFGDIWFNGFAQAADAELATKSFKQADDLTDIIESMGLPHNRAFEGGPAVVRREEDWRSVKLGRSGEGEDALPELILLTPTVDGLQRLASDWHTYFGRFARGDDDQGAAGSSPAPQDRTLRKSAQGQEALDLEQMASESSGPDRSVPNGSSIAFVLEHRGRRMLFLGDAHADDYEKAYASWLSTDATQGHPLSVVKLSHHGSRANTTINLAGFGATTYFISSDGGRYDHPDDATLARLVVGAPPGIKPCFRFNYRTPTAERWAAWAVNDNRFQVELPAVEDDAGTCVILGHRG